MANVKVNVKVNNMPVNQLDFNEYKYIVARPIDNEDGVFELWYWGSWKEYAMALKAASEISGLVFELCEVLQEE